MVTQTKVYGGYQMTKPRYEIIGPPIDAHGFSLSGSSLSVDYESPTESYLLPAQYERDLVRIAWLLSNSYFSDKGLFFNFGLGQLLPAKEVGYYTRWRMYEYDVGERRRREERLVTGESGEIYYSADHYKTLVLLTR